MSCSPRNPHDGLAIEPALNDPTPTAEKRLNDFNRRIDWDRVGKTKSAGPKDIPALDVATLQRQYGPQTAYRPREMWGSFRAPVGATHAQYERIKYDAVRTWLDHMDREGWQFRSEYRIQVFDGMYPAYDIRDRIPLLDQRQFNVRAFFCKRNPETIRHELDPLVTEPFRVRN
jgi:hypothetical protein